VARWKCDEKINRKSNDPGFIPRPSPGKKRLLKSISVRGKTMAQRKRDVKINGKPKDLGEKNVFKS
jgi:hypothetical protein